MPDPLIAVPDSELDELRRRGLEAYRLGDFAYLDQLV